MSLTRRRKHQLIYPSAGTGFVPRISAGTESRGGLGHVYIKTYYSHVDADSGFDSNGNEASLVSTAFLDRIREAYDAQPDLPNLLVAPYFRDALNDLLAEGKKIF